MAMPFAVSSFTPIHSNSLVPNTAPVMPVITTSTAVSEGKPPIFSDMPMATGAVADLGARDIWISNDPPNNRASKTELPAAIPTPQISDIRTGNHNCRNLENC